MNPKIIESKAISKIALNLWQISKKLILPKEIEMIRIFKEGTTLKIEIVNFMENEKTDKLD